jgi:hypothetical protein
VRGEAKAFDAAHEVEPRFTSVLTEPAIVRLGLAVAALAFLWLAILWAVLLP